LWEKGGRQGVNSFVCPQSGAGAKRVVGRRAGGPAFASPYRGGGKPPFGKSAHFRGVGAFLGWAFGRPKARGFRPPKNFFAGRFGPPHLPSGPHGLGPGGKKLLGAEKAFSGGMVANPFFRPNFRLCQRGGAGPGDRAFVSQGNRGAFVHSRRAAFGGSSLIFFQTGPFAVTFSGRGPRGHHFKLPKFLGWGGPPDSTPGGGKFGLRPQKGGDPIFLVDFLL